MIPVNRITEHVVAQVRRHYSDSIDREDRIVGDELLLAKLSRWQLDRQTVGGPLPPVSAIKDAELEAIVDEVLRYCHGAGIHWQLAGDQSVPLIERIDQHFAPLQVSEEERRQEAERIAQVQAEGAAVIEQDVIARSLERDRAIWALP